MRALLPTLALPSLLFAGSCGAAPATPTVASTPSDPPGYDVHEWGLLRGTDGDVLILGALPPPDVRMPMAVDKPVLYFHADAALTLTSVMVDAHDGAIVEAWPPVPRTGIASDLVWANVAIDPSGACEPSALPGITDAACTSLPAGEICEAASLGAVRVPGAACLHVAESVDSMLFYHARTQSFTPPLTFERTNAYEDVTVANTGDAPIPGWLVRLRDDDGAVSALAIRPPAPHESIVVGQDFRAALANDLPAWTDETMIAAGGRPASGRTAIRLTMRELGMDDAEVDAFLRAWDETLFGLTAAASHHRDADHEDRAIHLLSAEVTPAPRPSFAYFVPTPPVPRESFVYFLPTATADDVARVTFDPPPRTFRRAFAIWSSIRPSGTWR